MTDRIPTSRGILAWVRQWLVDDGKFRQINEMGAIGGWEQAVWSTTGSGSLKKNGIRAGAGEGLGVPDRGEKKREFSAMSLSAYLMSLFHCQALDKYPGTVTR